MNKPVITDQTLLSLPDCASLTEKGGCTKLKTDRCLGIKCSFFTASKNSFDTNSWKKRLSSLPEDAQNKISKKYYNGSRPWKGGGL